MTLFSDDWRAVRGDLEASSSKPKPLEPTEDVFEDWREARDVPHYAYLVDKGYGIGDLVLWRAEIRRSTNPPPGTRPKSKLGYVVYRVIECVWHGPNAKCSTVAEYHGKQTFFRRDLAHFDVTPEAALARIDGYAAEFTISMESSLKYLREQAESYRQSVERTEASLDALRAFRAADVVKIPAG